MQLPVHFPPWSQSKFTFECNCNSVALKFPIPICYFNRVYCQKPQDNGAVTVPDSELSASVSSL